MKLIVIDADYTYNKTNEPVIRLYGKVTDGENDGKDVVLHVVGIEPYIYLGNCDMNIFELQKKVEEVGRGYLKRVEIVKRFKPIGYQIEKSDMLRLILFNPKIVPDLRKMLKENIKEVTDSQLYEADIPFANRGIVDKDINGMDVIEFDERDKKFNNYGIGCNNLYICELDNIRVLKDEISKIEY